MGLYVWLGRFWNGRSKTDLSGNFCKMQADAEVAEGRLREIGADLRNLEELHRMRMQSNPDKAMVSELHGHPNNPCFGGQVRS